MLDPFRSVLAQQLCAATAEHSCPVCAVVPAQLLSALPHKPLALDCSTFTSYPAAVQARDRGGAGQDARNHRGLAWQLQGPRA